MVQTEKRDLSQTVHLYIHTGDNPVIWLKKR